jgi:NADPH:quinone reductase-like Zn-dependent oxidoreductase
MWGDVCRLIDEGSVHPILPLSTYRISDIERAFRTLLPTLVRSTDENVTLRSKGCISRRVFFVISALPISSFARGIRRATGEVGVDVIVNSLAGDLLRETWECLGLNFPTLVRSTDENVTLRSKGCISRRVFFVISARGIRRATGEVGVDVIVNSLAGDLLRETWECLAPFAQEALHQLWLELPNLGEINR